jgi:hypothetical protein
VAVHNEVYVALAVAQFWVCKGVVNNTGSIRAKRPDSFEGIPVTYTSSSLSVDAIES